MAVECALGGRTGSFGPSAGLVLIDTCAALMLAVLELLHRLSPPTLRRESECVSAGALSSPATHHSPLPAHTMSGKDSINPPPGSRPTAPRRTSSNQQVASMPAYGVSPTIAQIPPRDSPQVSSPVLTPHNMDTAREEGATPTTIPDSEIPTPVNPSDLDSLPITDEQKARIIERQ